MFKKSIYLLPLCSLILLINGCSSTFGTHDYNNNFGLAENFEADQQLKNEEIATNMELEKFNHEMNNFTKFQPEKGTFLAEDWVQPEPVITYLYPYDEKFYTEDELPKNKARLGDVVVKVPSSMNKEEFLQQLESGMFDH
ncbi:MAG: Unknown protein [uncultured Sulfurovum sp.]|uniref:Uncharacterized protein n=1 Tax=uncultured Sulfurovum sp. TaxID=269237 RepID=A0A6S6SXW0_9BACT|nr:MAG: Unknown protein [uncultured Sulfurovum sp.]